MAMPGTVSLTLPSLPLFLAAPSLAPLSSRAKSNRFSKQITEIEDTGFFPCKHLAGDFELTAFNPVTAPEQITHPTEQRSNAISLATTPHLFQLCHFPPALQQHAGTSLQKDNQHQDSSCPTTSHTSCRAQDASQPPACCWDIGQHPSDLAGKANTSL